MGVFVFMIFPAHGHINPTLPIVKELVSKGERVVYYGTPDLKAKIIQSGAEYRAYNISGLDFNCYGILQNLFAFSAYLFRIAFRIARCHLQEIARLEPDCMVYDSLWAAGKVIALKLGIPSVNSVPILVCDDGDIKSAFTPLFIIRMVLKNILHIGSMLVYWLLIALRARLFLNPFDVFLNKAPLNIVYTSKYFQPRAEVIDNSFCFVGPSITQRNDGDNFPLQKLEGKKVIYISFGTIVNDRLEFYKDCIELFRESYVLLVISIGNRIKKQNLSPLPPYVIMSTHVPQLEVLRNSAVFITHAGMNSIQEALYFGVPLVMLPQTPEQEATAARVAELGAGISLNKDAYPGEIRRAVEMIMREKKFARNARTIGKTLREAGGYKRAVREIFAYTAQGQKDGSIL
jgi:MGT family glycosyltransferase